jgi:uncharacterized protein (DUF1501 family)
MFSFVQLNGGNDGLNTFVPYDNPYYDLQLKIALNKDKSLGKNKGMAFSSCSEDFAQMQQNGDLSMIQNVGYLNLFVLSFSIRKFGKPLRFQ